MKSGFGSDDAQLDVSELASGAPALEQKLLRFSPRFVCFISKNAYQAFYGSDAPAFGLQPKVIGSSGVFVVPSPSARVSSNRILDGRTRVDWFRELRNELDR